MEAEVVPKNYLGIYSGINTTLNRKEQCGTVITFITMPLGCSQQYTNTRTVVLPVKHFYASDKNTYHTCGHILKGSFSSGNL